MGMTHIQPTWSRQKLCGTVSSVCREPNLVARLSTTCISKPHLINTSTCKCPSSSFQMTSLTTKIYTRKPSIAMYTWKFGAACTVYHKPASWQTSYYPNTWDNMATSKYNTRLVFENTSPGPSGLICTSTTLVSNTLATKKFKHLFSALCTEAYKIVEDWAGNLYCSINLEWNYGKRWVDIAMPIYAIKNLTRYNHLPPLKPQHCPYTPNWIIYGKDNQATIPSNTSLLLDAASK
jgi:hypothetical protein